MEPQVESKETKSESWRDIVCVLSLFYLPPIGVIVTWMVSRWSVLTKWIITIFLGIVPLTILGMTSYSSYKIVKYQRDYQPVLAVQQALDMYGIKNGKYPDNLDALKPNFLKEVPTDKIADYKATDSNKNYTLKAKLNNKEVELRPAFAKIPGVD